MDIRLLCNIGSDCDEMIAQNVDAKLDIYNWTIPQDILSELFSLNSLSEIPVRVVVSEKIKDQLYYGVAGVSIKIPEGRPL